MASYIDEGQDLLSGGPLYGDPDAETWSNLDPLGDEIFGWGAASKNRAIRARQAKIRALQGQISADQLRRLEQAATANTEDWNKLTTQILGPDGQRLNDFYSDLQGRDAAAFGEYKNALGDYSSLTDLFNDPNFYGDVGDVTNKAIPSQATVQDQRELLAQMRAQTSPQETAQERLMRYVAQNEAEANMRGARESIANNLKARGAYGSGAEVVQNMMAQADAANRRYQANLAANAQAQERATKMLGSSADLASKMRGQETQEGALANQVNMFNNQVNQNLMNQRSGAQLQATDKQNTDLARRASSIYQGATQLTGRERADEGAKTNTMMGLTQGTIGVRNAGTNSVNAGYGVFSDLLGRKAAEDEGQIETPLFGGGVG